MSKFGALEDFFWLEGMKPIGFSSLLLEMAQEGDFLILKHEQEITRMLEHLEEKESKPFGEDILQKILGFFKSKKTAIKDDDIIVDVNYFRQLYSSLKNRLGFIFKEDLILEKKVFEERVMEEFTFNSNDRQAIIFLLKKN